MSERPFRGTRRDFLAFGGGALGSPLEGGAWRVGIRSPASESVKIGEVDVSDAAIASFGMDQTRARVMLAATPSRPEIVRIA